MRTVDSRREFLRGLAVGSMVLPAGTMLGQEAIHLGSRVVEAPNVYRSGPAVIENGKVVQPRHEIRVLSDTEVLVVGGGCAGVIAALAAARAGQRVTLVERYGCFGGLWTAGLVLIVLATHVKTQAGLTKCVRGIGDELLQRLLAIKGGIINQGPGMRNPTSDPEATKYVMAEMLREAGVEILLHSWAVNAIMQSNDVKGVVFESKSSSYAITSRIVVDATGDGDVYAAAGAEHVRHIHRIGLVHRLGNVDRIDNSTAAAGAGTRKPGAVTPHPSVRWVNMQGPQGDCLDVKTLTQTELDGRRAVWQQVKALQQRPGHEQVFLLDTASQLGIRASRTLKGLVVPTYEEAMKGKRYRDSVGVGGGGDFLGERACDIPYGALVPVKVDNLLAAGRCIAGDNLMMNYLRLIGPCLVSGQAAGAAAALAVQRRRRPRDLEVVQLQALLKKQGVHFG
ncbi:MAG: FAD-dependent oxidoreductase [Acidobacteria bacterium]|nr:FAD-dependent oxidoreductase [Acidobacteriota bacterium]